MDKILALLQYYNFESSGSNLSSQELSQKWLDYKQGWMHLAIVEAIYQGRYKLASVDYILKFWQKRGEPVCRFNREFERLICSDFDLPLPINGIYSSSQSSLPKLTSPKPTSQVTANQNHKENLAQTKEIEQVKIEVQKEHRIALHQMQLLAESSLFVDKLKSMCVSTIVSSQAELPISLDSTLGLLNAQDSDNQTALTNRQKAYSLF